MVQENAAEFWSCLKGTTAQGLEAHDNKVICFSKGDDTWYLKQRLSRDLCQKNQRVAQLCEQAGVPAASPVLTDDGDGVAQFSGHLWVLTTGLPGKELKDINPETAKLPGSSIARFQKAFEETPDETFPAYDSSLKSLLRRLDKLEGRERDAARLITLFETFTDETHLKRGVIHRDAHPGNMCFDKRTFVGILDFDLVQHGPLLFDPCYWANSQLAKFWTKEDEPEAWLGILSGIIKGYFGSTALSDTARSDIYEMVLKAQLTFMVWLRETGQDKAADSCKRYIFWITQRRALMEAGL